MIEQTYTSTKIIGSDLNDLDRSLQIDKKIWAIGGGKGGVGKSMVTANTAILLAEMGYKVVAIDLDLGGANLHTCLGIQIPEKTLSDYISRKVPNIKDLLVATSHKNLQMISGAQDEIGIANLKHLQKNKLLNSLASLDADYVLLDLGAGTSFNTLDFFISSHKGLLVVLPEPTSIENTYRFIKSAYFRRLKMVEEFLEIQPLIQRAMEAKIGQRQSVPVEMVNSVIEMNPTLGLKLKAEVSKLKFQIIMNQVRTQNDIDIGHSIQSVCKKYFGIQVEFIGHLDYDQSAWQSVKKRKPVVLEYPQSNITSEFKGIVKKLHDH